MSIHNSIDICIMSTSLFSMLYTDLRLKYYINPDELSLSVAWDRLLKWSTSVDYKICLKGCCNMHVIPSARCKDDIYFDLCKQLKTYENYVVVMSYTSHQQLISY